MYAYINPGSEHTGGTLKQAKIIAATWLQFIHSDGMVDVEIDKKVKRKKGGNFEFTFRHKVTGVERKLETHGFSDEQIEGWLFKPRIYWDGSSTSSPTPEDWLTDEYRIRIVYDKIIE